MDNYPGDLLAGVFPLVFGVDSILRSDGQSGGDGGTTEDGSSSSFPTRSIFERFLDSVASSLMHNDANNNSGGNNNDANRRSRIVSAEAPLSFLMRSEEDDSSDEDDLQSIESGATSKRFRMSLGSPSLVMSPKKPIGRSSSSTKSIGRETSYAKSLSTEGFFQRARIISISTKHGFPPSKDSEGQENRALKLSLARSSMAMNPTKMNAFRLKKILDEHPIDGILPLGWLEKHVHALPSVLLVVTALHLADPEFQERQDTYLLENIEHLRESLASKRECHIRLVCLVEFQGDPSDPMKIDEWKNKMQRQTNLQISILFTPDDLLPPAATPGANTSEAIRDLQSSVRDASWAYYKRQCRRVKRKLSVLGHEQQPNLLPLAVRYCFKIGIFYEFQLKHEKSLRYLSDAYSHLETYYRHLQGAYTAEAPINTATKAVVNPQADDEIEATLSAAPPKTPSNADGGVEISLVDDGPGESKTLVESPPNVPIDVRRYFEEMEHPPDMAHQCRAVADWLNLKLLQAGFLSAAYSQSEQGALAASAQWRRHCQVFMKRDDVHNPAWNHWAFVAQQRHVMSQLVERYPPRDVMSLTGLAKDEVMMRCSTWRNYTAAAEAMLRLGVEIRKARQEGSGTNAGDPTSLRGRFVGAFESEGLAPKLDELSKGDHTAVALDMVRRAISRFEAEAGAILKDKGEDDVSAMYYYRRGVRMYYLAGGILLGQSQYEEAIGFLEKAVKYAAGWSGQELAIRRMLIEAYEKHLPTQKSPTPDQSNIIASMILDSRFNAAMPARNLRKALNNFSSLSDGDMLRYSLDCMDELDSSLPFAFAVTFPKSTHATAGDSVAASVIVRSNLDYAVHINSITLLSMAGDVPLSPNVLMSAENASEGNDGGIIIQGKKSIFMTIQIDLPKDLDDIATDESGNGGEKLGVAGKGSFSKSARPRTAGITSAAGARLYSERENSDKKREKNGQWSLKQLGGKPFRCDGIRLVFYPVHVAKAAAASGGDIAGQNLIELTMEKKKPKTAANIKRTPFEEDNYLASAWSRPQQLPLVRGPRCLRVLGPMSQMLITNLTDPLINGMAFEGTVNRVLLKLKAGPNEICRDLRYTISCSSLVLQSDGTTKHLKTEEEITEDGDGAVAKVVPTNPGPDARLPIFVEPDKQKQRINSSEFGYDLPSGWAVLGASRGIAHEGSLPVASLEQGQETYIYFDIFRPAPTDPQKATTQTEHEGTDVCQTDFDFKITYKQARPRLQQNRGRRRRKPPPGEDGSKDGDSEQVSLEYSASVLWESPLEAEFVTGTGLKKGPPSGSRHPSNALPNSTSQEEGNDSTTELALIDGECVNLRCILKAKDPTAKTKVSVRKVWFEEATSIVESDQPSCKLRPIPDASYGGTNTLFESKSNDPSRTLGQGTKFGIVYGVEASMKDAYKQGCVTTSLGVLCVDWMPTRMEVPDEVRRELASLAPHVRAHGPLELERLPTVKFHGPPCYIENAPFDTSLIVDTSTPRIGVPFGLTIDIENKTALHQVLKLNVDGKDKSEKTKSSVLLEGIVNHQMRLSPFEKRSMSYTAVALKAGKVILPAVSISSDRYQAWVINDAKSNRSLFVVP